jgi:hypothetical protein
MTGCINNSDVIRPPQYHVFAICQLLDGGPKDCADVLESLQQQTILMGIDNLRSFLDNPIARAEQPVSLPKCHERVA